MEQQMADVRDRILALVKAHEAMVHAGHACAHTRLSIVGYLCHVLAIKPCHFERLGAIAAEYDRVCPCPPVALEPYEGCN